MISNESSREQWGSKLGFILAAAGSAIGLGNIWKFPYVAGENGGAAFILIYLVCAAIIGLPVLIAEVLIGRTTNRNPVGAFKLLSGSKFWTAVGGMGVIAGFIILSYYAVIAGWSLGYIVEAIKGEFNNFPEPAQAGEHFNSLVGSLPWIIGYFALFMSLTMWFVLSGVQKGIEKGSKIMMPVLFILLIILMVRGLTLDGASEGLEFLLKPDWDHVNAQTVLIALGQAFFTLSLGMGAMLTYGSYMSKKDNLFTSGFQIVILDTAIALIAGIAIFTAVFATGLAPNVGPGLIFHTLPVVFLKMPGGYIFAIVFFILLTIAALTSAISLLEVITAYFVDEKRWSRKKAVYVFGTVTFLIGLPSALSFNVLSDFHLLGLNFFDLADYLSSNILLPLGGMLLSVFVGYVWGFDKALIELKRGAEKIFERYPLFIKLWQLFVKYFAPVLIFLVLLHSIGVF
ncbi:MAG: sodium-dependent transporter [Melioribacteraceae bacterium]|nr:sodium-dependent transporter [Melioribacteraceae bacterium]